MAPMHVLFEQFRCCLWRHIYGFDRIQPNMEGSREGPPTVTRRRVNLQIIPGPLSFALLLERVLSHQLWGVNMSTHGLKREKLHRWL